MSTYLNYTSMSQGTANRYFTSLINISRVNYLMFNVFFFFNLSTVMASRLLSWLSLFLVKLVLIKIWFVMHKNGNICFFQPVLTRFSPMFHFYPLKMSEKLWFSGVFKGYRNGALEHGAFWCGKFKFKES